MVQQAYLLAANDLFWISAWLSLAMIPLIWFARRTYGGGGAVARSEEHTSELQSLMRISYAVFCLKKTNKTRTKEHTILQQYNKKLKHTTTHSNNLQHDTNI